MADASPAQPSRAGRRNVVLAHPQPERLRAVAMALAREFTVELVGDGGAALEALAFGRCSLAVVAMPLPGLSGLEALRRLGALRLEQRPLVLAVGAADDVRLKVVATHGLADGILAMPCADGILLRRIWQLVDRELEQRWARLPPLQRTVVGSTRGLLQAAGAAVRDGGELASEAARLAGRQMVEALARG